MADACHTPGAGAATALRLAYSSNAYGRHTVEEAIDRIAGLGYEGMELMADVPHAWPADITEAGLEAIRRRLDRHSLQLSNVNAFMMKAVQDFWHPSWIEPDPDFRRRRVQHTIDALTMAAKLGARCVTTEPGGPLEESMARQSALEIFVEGLNEALGHAETVGVQLLVEPEPGLLIENAEQFLELADRIDSPMFGLNFDIGHFFCAGPRGGPYATPPSGSLPETVRRLAPMTRHYHIEDIAATRVHEHLIPGRGAIDLPAVLEAIRATGYDGWITVELYPYLDDPDAAGSEALRYLSGIMPS